MALKWGFYGRKAEMAHRVRKLQIETRENLRPVFPCTGVTRRRGFGKNALLDRTMQLFNQEICQARRGYHRHGRNGRDNLFLFELLQDGTPPDGDAVDGRWLYNETCLRLMHTLPEEVRPQPHRKGI